VSPNFTKYTQPAQFQTLADNILNKVKPWAEWRAWRWPVTFPFNPGAIAGRAELRLHFEIEGKPVLEGRSRAHWCRPWW
jgi:hypothetical protein